MVRFIVACVDIALNLLLLLLLVVVMLLLSPLLLFIAVPTLYPMLFNNLREFEPVFYLRMLTHLTHTKAT